jgi:predicted HD phosphohydrolase
MRTTFKSFAESTAEDWAVIMSASSTVEALVPDRVLEQLRYLANDDGGFPVTRLEHSLQTATRAERDGRDLEYVLCALLHDIGDPLAPSNHAALAAAVLMPFVSEANHWMVEHHGVFQGYYFWHHVGADRNAREEFRESPYFEHAAEFCAKYDQVAFDADYRSEPLEHFEPLIRSLLVPATLPATSG